MKKNQLFEIYLVSNTQNNKVYIGATSQGSAKRFKQHVWKSESGSNYSFHKAIREFGTVEQLDLQGKRIALFYSIAEASRQTGVSLRTIKEHCAGVYLNNKNIKNCTWRKIEDVANLTAEDLNVLHTQENVAMSKRAGNNTRKVALYNQDNELIKIFDTLEDASKLTNVDRSTVGKQLKRYGIRIIPNVGYLKFYKE